MRTLASKLKQSPGRISALLLRIVTPPASGSVDSADVLEMSTARIELKTISLEIDALTLNQRRLAPCRMSNGARLFSRFSNT